MGFLDSLFGALGGVGSVAAALQSVLQFLYSLLVAVATALYNLIVAVFNFFLAILQQVAAFLRHIWDGFFKPILTKLANAIIKMHAWLEEKLGPVVRFLQRVRKWMDTIFTRYVKPFLNLIQHIRRFLLVLRLLHIGFATTLDRKLAQIEGGVARVFIEIRGILNSIIDMVNAVTNPPKLARIIAATMGGRRVFASLTRLWTGLPLGHFFPNTASSALPWERPFNHFREYQDPVLNPPASAILGTISITDFFLPAETDPTPTDLQIDESGDSYIAAQALAFLQTADDIEAAGIGPGLDVAELLAHGTGNMITMQEFSADVLTMLNPDLPTAVRV